MTNVNWSLPTQQPNEILSATLVGGAQPAVVATVDTRAANKITVSVAVSVAALTGFQVWARGDSNAAWIPIATASSDFTSVSGLSLSVRSDNASDLTTTPVGVTAVFSINTASWSDVQVLAASAGNAVLAITAGRKQ